MGAEFQDGIHLVSSGLPSSGNFLTSIDIIDAYLHVPICIWHQRFLHFAVQDVHYQFVALSFSLASSPWVFFQGAGPGVGFAETTGDHCDWLP